MSEDQIIGFIPEAALSANQNLKAFIEQSKVMLPSIFAPKFEVKWEDNLWYVGDSLAKERSTCVRIYFTSEGPGRSHKKDLEAFSGCFADFAKAYVVYNIKIKEDELTPVRLIALRFLYAAVRKRAKDPSITKVRVLDFDIAANAIEEKYTNKNTQSSRLGQLNCLADFVNDNYLVEGHLHWKRRLPIVGKWRNCTSEEARKLRHEKLPDRETITGFAHAFCIATLAADQLVTSIMALLSCAPSRICEVLRATNDIYVPREERGRVVHGIRWRPAKGGRAGLKVIPEAMIDVFWKAYNQIKEHTAEARKMALWYEQNPTQLFLPPSLEYLRKNPAEIRPIKYFEEIAWKAPSTSISTWLGGKGVAMERRGAGKNPRYYTSWAAIEKAILKLLPLHFPFTDRTKRLKFSDALIVLPLNFFYTYHSRVMIQGTLVDGIADRFTGSRNYKSVFVRLNIMRKDGSPVSITTHKFRIWLNTIAQETGELSQEDVAMWSGRADIHQNIPYDQSDKEPHREDALSFAALQESKLEQQIVTYKPVSIDEFNALKDRPPMHATKYGFCMHDYSMPGCQKFRDCLNCSEHCWIKGLSAQEQHTKMLKELYCRQLEEAEGMITAGDMSSENTWYKTTKKAYEHICTITDLMDDDSVPERTPMMINVRDEHDPFVEAMTERYHLTGDATAANAIEDTKEKKGKGPVILTLKKTKT